MTRARRLEARLSAKSCPWCGTCHDLHTAGERPWTYVVCFNCGAQGPAWGDGGATPLARWDTRPASGSYSYRPRFTLRGVVKRCANA